MQALIALPNSPITEKELFQPVSGVPLLTRVLATAAVSGVDSAVVAHPRSVAESTLRAGLKRYPAPLPETRFVALEDGFADGDLWSNPEIRAALTDPFLLLPWNLVTTRHALLQLIETAREGDRPVMLALDEAGAAPKPAETAVVVRRFDPSSGSPEVAGAEVFRPLLPAGGRAGLRLVAKGDRRAAERVLLQGAGKAADGLYSNINRKLCRPIARVLARTPITANMITLTGLPTVALAAWFYSFGDYWWSVLGALFYFAVVEIDELDGMIARTKFQESPFGNKLESFVDFVTYIVMWCGIGWGLYVSRGEFWLWVTAAVLIGTALGHTVQIIQRRLAAPAERPQDHMKVVLARLDADQGNPISRISRKLYHLTKKGALAHSTLWFTLLGRIDVYFILTTIGSHCLWMGGLYANRFFRPSSKRGVTSSTYGTN